MFIKIIVTWENYISHKKITNIHDINMWQILNRKISCNKLKTTFQKHTNPGSNYNKVQ